METDPAADVAEAGAVAAGAAVALTGRLALQLPTAAPALLPPAAVGLGAAARQGVPLLPARPATAFAFTHSRQRGAVASPLAGGAAPPYPTLSSPATPRLRRGAQLDQARPVQRVVTAADGRGGAEGAGAAAAGIEGVRVPVTPGHCGFWILST